MRIERDQFRTGWPWLVSAVVVLVTGAVVVVTNTRDDRLVVPAGRYAPTTYEIKAQQNSATLTLPTGVLTVGVTEALADVDDSAQWRERRPADGSSFVGITTSLSQTRVSPAAAGTSTADTISTPFTVAVVADGRRYPIRAAEAGSAMYALPAGGGLRGYVAVAGSPRDVAVEVDFDGERQTVNPRTGRRDAGRFAELARTTDGFAERDCPAPALPRGYRATEFGGPPSCTVENALRTPWVAGLGWSPAGRSWQAVAVYLGRNLDLESTATGARYSSTTYGNRTTITLAGQTTKGTLADNDAPPTPRTNTLTGLFLVDRGSAPASVEVSTTFAQMVRDDDAPASTPLDPTFVISWKVPVS